STSTLGAGSHSITAVYGGDSNDSGNTSSALSQTVNKAALTVKVRASGTYGSSPNLSGLAPTSAALTYTGSVGRDRAPNAVGGTLTCSTTATSSSPVGSYPVTGCSGLTASNYTISYDPASSYQVTPISVSITLNPTSGPAGTSVTVSSGSFTAGNTVTITLAGT